MDKNTELKLLAFYMTKYAKVKNIDLQVILKGLYTRHKIKSRTELPIKEIIALKESYKVGCKYATFFNT